MKAATESSSEKNSHGPEYTVILLSKPLQEHKHRHRYLDTNEGVHQIEKFAWR